MILKINTNFHAHKTGEGDAAFNAQAGSGADRSCADASDSFVSDCAVDTKRRGARDLNCAWPTWTATGWMRNWCSPRLA